MRPKPIIRFERALLIAVAIELINNFVALPALSRGLALRGFEMTLPLKVASVAAAPALCLILWYFIARRASVIAKWLLTIFVAFTLYVFFGQMAETPLKSGNVMLMAAVIADLLKIYAVVCLFLPGTRSWFHPENVEEEADEEGA